MKAPEQTDASRNKAINPVTLLDGRKVSWAEAFPRDTDKVAREVREQRAELEEAA